MVHFWPELPLQDVQHLSGEMIHRGKTVIAAAIHIILNVCIKTV